MQEHLKPLPENIHLDNAEKIEREFSFDILMPEDSPLSDFVNQYAIKVVEKIDEEVFGVINQIALENGFKTDVIISKSFIVDAIEKKLAKKPIGEFDSVPHWRCPKCNKAVVLFEKDTKFPNCHWCGQKLDWSEEYERTETDFKTCQTDFE